VLLDTGGTPKKAPASGRCFWFRTPERYVSHLINAGYDLVSVANNHQMDFGMEGRLRTLQVLDSVGLACAGAPTHRSAVIERNGVKYGFCAFSTNTGCVSMTDLDGVETIIAELKAQCDVVIVSMHGGNEGVDYRHVPFKSEFGLPEPLGNVHQFAHFCVDAGADVFFGHGPHVSRAVELYKDRLIAYSLGNFCTPYGMNLGSSCGVAPMLEVCVDRSGNFVSAQIHPVVQSWGKGPRIDPQRRAIREIKELTEVDFPDTPLQIADDGTITKR
jgi:poly-gamma-glutamate capsule biosynthesis protein CapA/YwtB (metallophosphatase superfamily)